MFPDETEKFVHIETSYLTSFLEDTGFENLAEIHVSVVNCFITQHITYICQKRFGLN
jgi:hypothetical protein